MKMYLNAEARYFLTGAVQLDCCWASRFCSNSPSGRLINIEPSPGSAEPRLVRKRCSPTDAEPSPTSVKPSLVIVEPSRTRHSLALQAWSLVLRLHRPALLAKPPPPPSQNYEAQPRESFEKALEPHEHQKAKSSPCFDRFSGDFLKASKFGFSGALQGQSPALRARSLALQVKSPDSKVWGPALQVRNAAPKCGALPYETEVQSYMLEARRHP
jgi:hypothetical protein